MDAQRNIALMGRSGTGKTTVARILTTQYGYQRCTPGDICRKVCMLLFGAENRTQMNQVTDALKELDSLIWLKAAMLNARMDQPIVYDSMRFASDYEHLRHDGFEVWRVESSDALRIERLTKRGQVFCEKDDEHALERELHDHQHDCLINNDPDIATGELVRAIERLMGRQAQEVEGQAKKERA